MSRRSRSTDGDRRSQSTDAGRRSRSIDVSCSRAVSDTIGFVFAFALVTAAIGVVYTSGIGGLEDAREDEQLTNAVRAFDVLADNVGDLRTEGAPSRATELKLTDASLGFGDPVRVEMQVNHTAPGNDANATYAMTTRPLVYDDSAGEVVYSAGATFRVDDGSAVMREEPDLLVGDRRAVVPLLIAYPRGNSTHVGGSTTVLVVAHRQSAGLDGQFDTGAGGHDARVNVTVESARAAAWGRYFEAKGMSAIDADASDGEVTYQFYTDHLLVPEAVVEFEIQA